ncbi:MAG: FAD-binding oxidoreductase [Rhizobiales bacterium]|nr:FAD-binding oxidoreductase [Hyphomicrobiales bacterium]
MSHAIFHPDFKAKPYWWEAYEPKALPDVALPKDVAVAIVGGGYAGMSAALELARNGIESIVLDAAEPGFGGSTRSGGLVSAGVNVGKRMINRALTAEEAKPFLNDAVDAFTNIENLIAENSIDCGWTKTGYFLGAWCQSHYDGMKKKIELINAEAQSDAVLVPRARQREHIGSDYYHGGMLVGRAAHLHPALYYKGLLDLVVKAGVPIASRTPVNGLTQESNGSWSVKTPRGTIKAGHVIIATNGYTGDVTPQFKRRVVPVGSYIIATEELSADLAKSLSPANRSFADTRRVLTYYRLSPDGKRMIFGGRAKFGFSDPVETAPMLHRFMIDRFPQLKGTRITHAWTGNVAFTMDELPHMGKFQGLHYALGCNGSGVAMMSFLGRETARKIVGTSNRTIAFDQPEFPTSPLYHGNPWFLPLVGAWFRTRDWIDRRFN